MDKRQWCLQLMTSLEAPPSRRSCFLVFITFSQLGFHYLSVIVIMSAWGWADFFLSRSPSSILLREDGQCNSWSFLPLAFWYSMREVACTTPLSQIIFVALPLGSPFPFRPAQLLFIWICSLCGWARTVIHHHFSNQLISNPGTC